MRWLARGLAGLLLAVLLGVAAAVFWVHERLEGEAFRARFAEEAGEALGREVGFASLDLVLVPPALVVLEPYVAGPAAGTPHFLDARSVSLRFELLPLLDRSFIVSSLSVREATLRLVRSLEGFAIPQLERESEPSLEDDGFRMRVRRVTLEDASLLFDDRVVSPPVQWRLDDVDARIDSASLEAPKQVDATIESDGGTMEVAGSVRLDGRVDLEARLDRFPLAPLDPFVPPSAKVSGRVTGRLAWRGAAQDPEQVAFEGRVDEAAVTVGPSFSLAGRVGLRGEVQGGLADPHGPLEVDATGAELRWSDVFRKPTGDTTRARVRFRRSPEGPFVFEGDLHAQTARFDTVVELGERTRIRLDAPPFAIAGWRPTLAVLSELRLSGDVGAQSVEILTDPLEIRGRARLDDVVLRFADGGDSGVHLAGAIVAEGERLHGEGLTATLPGGALPLELEVDDFTGAWRFHLRAQGAGVEANDLLGSFGRRDLLYGPIAVDADLRGSFGGERSFRERLAGRVALRIAPGRLRGVSLFEAVFRRAPEPDVAADAAASAQPRSRGRVGRSLERFYGDRFDSLEATLQLRDGLARTDDLHLEASYYSYTLQGPIRMRDLGLDAKGEMRLGRDVVASLLSRSSLPMPSLVSGVVVPLPAIRGTLTDPKPQVDWRHFWRTLLVNVPGAGLLRGIKDLGRKLPAR